ncbi:hypothetical protein BC349_10305 [Flavihumibacter stibioxidans]|uniref:Alpha-galactosidase n=2 Tax=Flavihumibacter stibioxidans TaxID=1834163 RepID=A0ABR7M8Z8_9BACT|nr:hypothetical protein [Flavihumibacter stibioxidans]
MILKNLLVASLAATLLSSASAQEKPFHTWAKTPPMGWNSWDCFGPTVTEAEVKANADYMAKHLKSYGWEYVVVDIRWYVSNDKAHGYNETDPQFNLDTYGRLVPASNRFPSAADGRGFKPLADYIHRKGLKFGIHIMRGIPVAAVKRKLPVKGSRVTAADIYSERDQCRWLRDMFTIEADREGAQEYYNSILELYASWGVDFIKVDDLSSPYHTAEVEMLRKAIDRTGRRILLSTSPGETPLASAAHVQDHANMWRTVGDFWDSWQQLKEHFTVFERWNPYRKTGAWPDGDMLPLGHIGIRAERGANRMSAFTRDEQYTLMTLWSVFRSPLMFGGHLPDNDSFTLSLMTNKAVLDLLNNSTNNRPLFHKNDLTAWTADKSGSKEKWLAVFNAQDQEMAVEGKAIWKSPVLTRANQTSEVNVPIANARKLYLVVTDANDNIEWDHADWINPIIYNEKDSLPMSGLKWKKATAGWGNPGVNLSCSGAPLIVGDQIHANGIGTHSNSVIEFELPEGYTHFKAMVGLDKAGVVQNVGATVQFMVFTEEPAGPMPATATAIPVQLSALGVNGRCRIIDCWSGEDLGIFSGEFSPVINRHGAGLFRISPAE